MKPTWETIPLPPLWEELTLEEQRAFLAGEATVKWMSRAEIEELYVASSEVVPHRPGAAVIISNVTLDNDPGGC